MAKSKFQRFVQYGLSSEDAIALVDRKLSVTTVRTTSQKNLVAKYGLTPKMAARAKAAVKRAPIEPDTLAFLLHGSAYLCCCCSGLKSQSYIVHHIKEYEKTQDNSYENLALLCPACHDDAHKGSGHGRKLTASDIKSSKRQWTDEVTRTRAGNAHA